MENRKSAIIQFLEIQVLKYRNFYLEQSQSQYNRLMTKVFRFIINPHFCHSWRMPTPTFQLIELLQLNQNVFVIHEAPGAGDDHLPG